MDFGNFGSFGNFGMGGEEEKVSPAPLSNTEGSSNETGAFSGFGGFGGFGATMTAEEFFKNPKEKTSKKAEEKKKGSANKKTSSKPVNDCEVQLPVRVVGRNISDKIEGEGKKKLSEIRKELIEKGYKQFLFPQMGLCYHEPSSTVYVEDSAVNYSNGENMVVLTKEVTVCDGMLQAVFSLENFEGKEADEVSVNDVIKEWVEINPSYKGCKMAYNEAECVMYPVVPVLTENDYAGKIKYISSYVQASGTYDMEEEKTYKEFVGQIEPMLTDYSTDKVKVELRYCNSGTLFVSYCSSNSFKSSSSGATVVTQNKKVEKKYILPLTLFVVTWGASYSLTPDMFGGKERVTMDQIKEVMAQKERMFADSSRRIDSYYDEANNKISIMFVSGTKGCELIRSAEELEKVKRMETFHGLYCEDSIPFRIMVTMSSVFYTFLKRCVPFKLGYERKYPLIPHVILEDIINEFKKDTSKEACCRIFYDFDENKFIYKFAKGIYTKTAAYYSYEDNEELLRGHKAQVVDIHSHNTMEEYFSHTDNKDDVYYGLFGVVGNLEKENPTIEMRVGADGLYQNIELSEIFEVV